ncbi:hypothetical protein Tco_0459415 [Tanacetum coccineum]
MQNTRTMASICLPPPTEGYEDASLIPEIVANNFEQSMLKIILSRTNSSSVMTKKPHASYPQVETFWTKCLANVLKIHRDEQVQRSSTRANAVVCQGKYNSSTKLFQSDVAELKGNCPSIALSRQEETSLCFQPPVPAPAKAVELSCVTCVVPFSPKPSSPSWATFIGQYISDM